MFDQIIRASEAMTAGRGHSAAALHPALWNCAECGTTRQIASPVWLGCKRCGEGLTLGAQRPSLGAAA